MPDKCLSFVGEQSFLEDSIKELLFLNKKLLCFRCDRDKVLIQNFGHILSSCLGNGAALPGIPLLVFLEGDEGVGIPANVSTMFTERIPWSDNGWDNRDS